jgi:hypothetical protein
MVGAIFALLGVYVIDDYAAAALIGASAGSLLDPIYIFLLVWCVWISFKKNIILIGALAIFACSAILTFIVTPGMSEIYTYRTSEQIFFIYLSRTYGGLVLFSIFWIFVGLKRQISEHSAR